MVERFLPKTRGEIMLATGVAIEAGAVLASLGLHLISGDEAAVGAAIGAIVAGAGLVKAADEIVAARQSPQRGPRSTTELQFARQYGDHYF